MDLLCPAVFFPKVAIIKTMSATIAFFSSNPFFLLALSFSPFLLELIRPKKPAFWRLFTQITANVVRLVFKKSSFRYSFVQYVSGHWIRSPEWKFLNSLLIRNRMDAKSGYNISISGDVIRSSPVPYSEYSIQDENLFSFTRGGVNLALRIFLTSDGLNRSYFAHFTTHA